MRFRIGIVRRECGTADVEILADYIENKATVKKLINYGIKHQTDWEFVHGSYFAEVLTDEGTWRNITDYWNNLALEGMEFAYDDGRVNDRQMDRFYENARYADSGEIDYILEQEGRFSEWYCS